MQVSKFMLYSVYLIEVRVQKKDSRNQKYENKGEREQMRLGYLLYQNSQLPTIVCVLSEKHTDFLFTYLWPLNVQGHQNHEANEELHL